MDILTRNFFRLLRSGSLNEYEEMEPMSAFKWHRLCKMVNAQQVAAIALKGIKNHKYDSKLNIPQQCVDELSAATRPDNAPVPRLSNRFLNQKLNKIRENEPHSIDTSIETVALLDIIVANTSSMLNRGISLRGIMELGRYLRTKGDRVDFVKLEQWLGRLRLRQMAQLQGSILIAVFEFEQAEVPFVYRMEPAAERLVIRTINHTAMDTANEWLFKQTDSGFVKSNTALIRRNLRRSIRYIGYAPIETVSNFINNLIRSLSEIEE